MARHVILTLLILLSATPYTKMDVVDQLLTQLVKPLLQNTEMFKKTAVPALNLLSQNMNFLKKQASIYASNKIKAMIKVLNQTSSGHQCFEDFNFLWKSASKGDEWAVKTFDSWGKFGNGLALLHLVYPGKISMCLKTRPHSPKTYSNHYCYFEFTFAFAAGRGIRNALCVPQSCSEYNLNQALNSIQDLIKKLRILPYFRVPLCYSHPKTDHFSSLSEKLSIIACIIVISLALMGTAYDLFVRILRCKFDVAIETDALYKKIDYQLKENKDIKTDKAVKHSDDSKCKEETKRAELRKRNEIKDTIMRNITLERSVTLPCFGTVKMKRLEQPGFFGSVFLSFSLITNLKELAAIKETGLLGSLHGIRALSIGWVVLGHTMSHLYPHSDNVFGFRYHLQPRAHLAPQILTAGYYAVDSFFVLGGLLLTYLFMRSREKGIKFNFLQYSIDRFLRLSPANWFLVFVIYWGLLSNNPQGPSDATTGYWVQSACRKTWWYYVLYINNFITEEECYGTGWYLANDMQFYLISPIFFFLFVKIGIWAGIFFIALLIISVVISIHIVMESRFLDYNFPLYDKLQYPHLAVLSSSLYKNFYIRPYCRVGSYFMGMFAGWLLYKINCKINISKVKAALLWGFGCLCLFYAFYIHFVFKMNKTGLYIFVATAHYVWSLGLVVIIFLCCSGQGGIINSILSWPGWLPLSKLSYCVYLMHFVIMKIFYYNTDEVFHLSIPDAFTHFSSLIISDFGGGLLLYLAVDAPFANLRKKFLY